MRRLLVAFGTKHGSTEEIAAAIAAALSARGHEVDLLAAADVRDLNRYDAVVIGSAVYMGHWQKEAMNLLKRHERELRDRPTWLFSSGPTGGTPDSDALVARARSAPTEPSPIKDVADRLRHIGARGHATFPGRISEEMTGLLERWMPRGDWRDFVSIEAWATQIAGELEPAAA
jgi:menaquinone-dependent protoporphyrinogen oxidase